MCCCLNTSVQTVTVQFVIYVQCAQHYCNTQRIAVRTHIYRQSQYNLLCAFSVHNFTVTHNVLLSEHTGTYRHSTICYVRSLCTTLLYHTMCCWQNIPVQTFKVQFFMYVHCAQHYCNTQCVLSEHTGTVRHSTNCYER
jgi:hypothetical protein